MWHSLSLLPATAQVDPVKMTISSRVRQEFYSQLSVHTTQLIRIPPTRKSTATRASRTASGGVSPWATAVQNAEELPLPTSSTASANTPSSSPKSFLSRLWTEEEHERFLEAIENFPHGPWKAIAEYIGNKTTRQVMSHAQKYRQKIARRKRGLQVARRKRKSVETKTAKLSRARKQRVKLTAAEKLVLEEAMEVSELGRPQSPCDVDLANLMELDDFDAQEFQLEDLQQIHSPAGFTETESFSQLLELLEESQRDDHDALVSSVNDFLNSLDVDQLVLESSFFDQNASELWCGVA